ncbi:type II secretion system protein [Calderihabitans maritimus]|uniref:General secretion pathway protein G n=1 Tax=Calderihabitans maritimus TaxID=1246530 RepID=A0A1Z5HX73_9FIRM|nr:prepilin-type N-terminal cleavage/methylation domain-containing protein [Calderihabitans maritimus]GAW94132.1 general secretion pathway protein G [Calderihabitans maritimus]
MPWWRITLALNRNDRGFTLLEVTVVAVVLGILAAMVVPRYLDAPERAREKALLVDYRTFQEALSLYYQDYGDYPHDSNGLEELVPDYLKKVPSYPWGGEYSYYYDSRGKDGKTPGYKIEAEGSGKEPLQVNYDG